MYFSHKKLRLMQEQLASLEVSLNDHVLSLPYDL